MSAAQADDVAQFVAAARLALPQEQITQFQVRSFGGSAAMSDTIIALIASGEKTGTFSLEAEFEGFPERRPVVGGLVVVTHFEGPPVLLYRLTEVSSVPYRDIGLQHVVVEGPNARVVDVWRAIHWPYWGAMLQTKGRKPSMQMPVVFQRFKLLFTTRT